MSEVLSLPAELIESGAMDGVLVINAIKLRKRGKSDPRRVGGDRADASRVPPVRSGDRSPASGVDGTMLKQAYAQKKLLERVTGLEVEPLLVFTQAWLVGSVPARRRGVVVLPGRMLAGYLARREPTIRPERASQIHEQLAAALSGAAGGAGSGSGRARGRGGLGRAGVAARRGARRSQQPFSVRRRRNTG